MRTVKRRSAHVLISLLMTTLISSWAVGERAGAATHTLTVRTWDGQTVKTQVEIPDSLNARLEGRRTTAQGRLASVNLKTASPADETFSRLCESIASSGWEQLDEEFYIMVDAMVFQVFANGALLRDVPYALPDVFAISQTEQELIDEEGGHRSIFGTPDGVILKVVVVERRRETELTLTAVHVDPEELGVKEMGVRRVRSDDPVYPGTDELFVMEIENDYHAELSMRFYSYTTNAPPKMLSRYYESRYANGVNLIGGVNDLDGASLGLGGEPLFMSVGANELRFAHVANIDGKRRVMVLELGGGF